MAIATQRLAHPPPITATPARALRRRLAGPLLIASEDGTSVLGALRVAEVLARRDGVHAHVLGLTRPLAPVLSRAVARVADLGVEDLEQCRRRKARTRVRRKVSHTVGLSTLFRTSGSSDDDGQAVTAAARAQKAEYIFVGLAPANTGARAAALEASERLAASAEVPVLAVPPDAQFLPRRALVHMDSGEAGMRAANAALPLLDDGASLTLATAVPHEAGVLQRFAATLGALAKLDVRTAVLTGDADELPDLVRNYDLVAAGNGDATGMLAAARGSILIV